MYGLYKFTFLHFVFVFNDIYFVLGLHCCVSFPPVAESGRSSPAAVHALLTVVASLVAKHGFKGLGLQQLWHADSAAAAPRLQSTGSIVVVSGPQCSAVCGNPPWSGIEPVSPALAGRFFTTEPPGKSKVLLLIDLVFLAHALVFIHFGQLRTL